MILLSEEAIQRIVRSPEVRSLPLMDAYQALCKAQLKKAVDEHAKHPEKFWQDLAEEVW
jgi:hypothetical protein